MKAEEEIEVERLREEREAESVTDSLIAVSSVCTTSHVTAM